MCLQVLNSSIMISIVGHNKMIDYIKCSFKCNHKLVGNNFIVKISTKDLDSNIDSKYGFYTGLDVKGKYNSNIKVRTLGDKEDNRIEISGNITKFLQGHNLFGITNLNKLVRMTVNKLIENKNLELRPTVQQLDDINKGMVHITRLDINRNFHLPSRVEADRWIIEAKNLMTMSYYGQVKQFDSTLYFGRQSKTKELKFYCKGAEIEANSSLPKNLKTPLMLDYANKMLRFEIRLNARYLNEHDLSDVYNWKDSIVNDILDKSLKRVELRGNIPISDKKITTLSPVLQSTYYLWMEGHDLKEHLSRGTYYRHKKELLKNDIDISIVLPKFDKATLDLADVLKHNVVGIPSWAYEEGLVAL